MNESQTIPIKLKRRLSYKHLYQFQNFRPKKVFDTAKYLVDTSDLFKSEGVEVLNAWLDNISLQSSTHEEWSEFFQDSDTSSDLQAYEAVEKDETQDCQNSISTTHVDNTGNEKSDSDGWCEVDERPSGVTDTLLQEGDRAENADRVIFFAPGEGNKPFGIFMDKYSEIYHSRQYSVVNEDLTRRKEKSLYLIVQFANGSEGVKIEELQCLCQTYFVS